MATETSIIETGVDKLVNLVKSKGRIASEDAVKYLGISPTVIMEWAEFLEEEGIINIEYKFTKPFLVARKLEKKEVQEKAKEFSGRKDVFIRKAEGSLSFLSREAAKLNKIKQEFDEIKKELGFDIGAVKNELEDLEKYERLKINLDKQIDDQKKTSMDKIELMARQITREKKSYEGVLEDIKKGEEELEKEKSETRSLEESERFIRERLNNLKEFIKKIENKEHEEEEEIKQSEEKIQKLILMVKNIKSRVEKEKELIGPLIEKSEEQSKKIKELQNRVIEKITEKEKNLKGTKSASKKIRDLFKKKMGILNFIEKVNKDRNDMEKDLIELIKKAKSFELSSKSGNIENQIIGIEKKFEEVDTKKKIFEKELKKLGSFFKS